MKLTARLLLVILMTTLVAAGQQRLSRQERKAAYAEREAALDGPQLEQRFALAQWCKEGKLYTQMRHQARAILVYAPNHAGAREMLGQMQVQGEWLSRKRAMNKLGFVRYRGAWRTLDQVAHMRMLEAKERRQKKLLRDITGEVRRLASRSTKTRTKARDSLHAIAKRESLPHLAKEATRVFNFYDQAYTAIAGIEVRATLSGPTSFRRFTTGLGTPGQPVTIELPTTRRISIGSTVGVPFGGR